MNHLVDRLLALVALAVLAPLLIVCGVVIGVSNPGPALYRARRVGLGGREFTMFKLRTMRSGSHGAAITSRHDPRVWSRFASWVRHVKIDELPQLVNVIRGEMAIVGPRPEDPAIVRRWYAGDDFETLRVLPGLTSPGSLYASVAGDVMLPAGDTERYYAEHVLPVTLALDRFYVRHASWSYDLRVVVRTCGLIVARLCGRESRLNTRELHEALAAAGVSLPRTGHPTAAAEPLRHREGMS